MNENLRALLILNQLKGFGAQTLKTYLGNCGTPAEVLRQCAKGKFKDEISSLLDEYQPDKDFEEHSQSGITVLGFGEEGYPRGLTEIYGAPLVLYVRGEIYKEDLYSVAIVGTRNPSHYGVETATRFAGALAERGITIISGFARGIDSAAHWGAIQAKGRTLAVLGCGVDKVYPPENEKLYGEVAAHGGFISEYPLGTQPLAYNFPQRNRLISGLSLGVLVVEAHEKSGSLITANFALEQGKEVFAIPGRIDSLSSRGTNRLIKSGALLVESPEDLLLALAPLLKGYLKEAEDLSRQVEEAGSEGILSHLEAQPLTLEELAAKAKKSPGEIASEITRLELKRLVKKLPDGRFSKEDILETDD